MCSRCVSSFADGESLRSHLSEPEGVTRCDPLRARRLSCVSRIRDPEHALSPPCARETTTALQTCVTCLRADRWVCSKRTHAHTHASRDGARNHSTPAHSALDLTLACEPAAVLEIIAPPLILRSTPVFTHPPEKSSLPAHSHSRTRVSHPPAPVVHMLHATSWSGLSRASFHVTDRVRLSLGQ